MLVFTALRESMVISSHILDTESRWFIRIPVLSRFGI